MSVAYSSSLITKHGDSELVQGDLLRLVLLRPVANHVCADALLSGLGKVLLDHKVVEVGVQT